MLKPIALRQAARLLCRRAPVYRAPSVHQFVAGPAATRSFLASAFKLEASKGDFESATTTGEPGESGDHEGKFARTDEAVRIEYPEEEDMPRSVPVQGRGGSHNLRTLASFSLEGRVGVVTGGARGLGLVMTQALVVSGADVAIVDMNSPFPTSLNNACCPY